MVQISSATAKTIVFPEAYKDFEDVFSIEKVCHLLPHKDYDHAIALIDGKQLFYGPIYSLSENKLSIFCIYIDKNLANKFICHLNIFLMPLFFLFPNQIEVYGYALTTRASTISILTIKTSFF